MLFRSELYVMDRVFIFVNDPIVRGIVPLKLLESKASFNRLVRNPIVLGIVDMRRMFCKVKISRLGKLPMAEGKVPSVLKGS